MTEPAWSEVERLAALRSYNILDTAPEPEFDDAVALVKTICETPVALVSLVDERRQWFKAKAGVDLAETDIETSVCALAIRQTETFVIEDLSTDPRTAHMSLVANPQGIRFYAGTPLITSAGIPLGSLCAIDVKPRPGGLTPAQDTALRALGRQVVAQIELRTAVSARDKAFVEQERRQDQATRDSAILQTMLQGQQRVLQAGGDFEAVLKALVEAALAAVLPADGVVVEMREGDDLVYRSAAGTSSDRIGLRIPIAGSLSGRALVEQVALVSADSLSDERGGFSSLLKDLGVRSLIVVPMSRRGEAFGVLKLHARVPDAFKSRHVLIGHILAGLIAASFSERAETDALLAAERTEQNYRHIVDSAIDSAIISTDAKGQITSWSRGAETIMGWSEAEMLGRPLDRIFTPEDVAAGRPQEEMTRAQKNGRSPDERWHVRKDTSRFYANGAVTPLLGGPGKGFVKSLRDVTDEHETKTALERSRLRLDTALDTGLIAFFHWNVRTKMVSGDSRFAEFFNLDRKKAELGVPVADAVKAVHPDDAAAVDLAIAQQSATCGDYAETYRTFTKDGGVRWILERGRCIEEDQGVPLVYVGTAVDVTQEREAEERLLYSRERLELATRAAKLGSFDYRPQINALDWDDRCRELFGVSPDTPISFETAFLTGLHPDDRDAARASLRAALDPAKGGVFDIEYRTIGIEDKIERSLLAKGLTSFQDGVAVRLIGTLQDVTADRRARAEILETEERFRLAVRATNDAVWDWDLRRDQVRWNEALFTVYGYTPQNVLPTSAWRLDCVHPEDRARVEASLHAVIHGDGADWIEEYRFARKGGGYADVRDRAYVIRDNQGKAVRMLGALLDQTDRKETERRLQSLNESLAVSVTARTEELERLWNSAPDLLLVMDFDGYFRRVNPAWTVILGYEPEELVGRHISNFLVLDHPLETSDAYALVAQEGAVALETQYRHKDGSLRWFSWVAAPVNGVTYATGRHITAEKAAEARLRATEEQLRQAQKVEAIGQLTGGVAHDFNNLLTVIRGSADLLRRPGLSEERRLRYIDAISGTADRATKLTNQLLAFARRSALKPEIFDAGASIRALSDMMQTLTGSLIKVDIDVAEHACWIDADPSQFDTAIVNMAVNARDAMNRQGELRIKIRPVQEMPAVRSHPKVAGDFVAVSISDQGVGIAPDKLEQIFEPFFTTKGVGEGTGLGLSQVFGFSKQSGGEIGVESTLGVGTTFTLYLPRADGGAHAPRRRDDGAPDPARGARILVVEDNGDVGTFATQALAELGHVTVLTTSAEEALETLAAGSTGFDAVFSDVVMPGMKGVEMGHEIRRLYPNLPVLLTSGYSNVIAAEGAHGFDLLHKPYSVEDLSKALRNLIAGQGAD